MKEKKDKEKPDDIIIEYRTHSCLCGVIHGKICIFHFNVLFNVYCALWEQWTNDEGIFL